MVIGQRFSNLVVLSTHRVTGKHEMATCRCDCGNVKTIRLHHILSGRQKGCGCGRAHTLTHGKAGTAIYFVWRSMRDRCENPNNKKFNRYGGRGITVCQRWKDFSNFLADMGERPVGMTIERIDNDGDYEPGNCEWVTRVVQNNNTIRNQHVSYGGQTMTIAEALRASGCSTPERTVRGRIARGWDFETAMKP